MTNIIQFPLNNDHADPYDEYFDQARRSIETRFGMSLFQYLKLEGDTEERNQIVQRVLQKETLKLITKLATEISTQNDSM